MYKRTVGILVGVQTMLIRGAADQEVTHGDGNGNSRSCTRHCAASAACQGSSVTCAPRLLIVCWCHQ